MTAASILATTICIPNTVWEISKTAGSVTWCSLRRRKDSVRPRAKPCLNTAANVLIRPIVAGERPRNRIIGRPHGATPPQKRFGQAKSETLPEYCRQCSYQTDCWGGMSEEPDHPHTGRRTGIELSLPRIQIGR